MPAGGPVCACIWHCPVRHNVAKALRDDASSSLSSQRLQGWSPATGFLCRSGRKWLAVHDGCCPTAAAQAAERHRHAQYLPYLQGADQAGTRIRGSGKVEGNPAGLVGQTQHVWRNEERSMSGGSHGWRKLEDSSARLNWQGSKAAGWEGPAAAHQVPFSRNCGGHRGAEPEGGGAQGGFAAEHIS